MIKISKSTKIPAILSGKGAIKTKALIENYLQNKSFFDDKKSSDVFDSKVYGDKEVKSQLIKDQHGKCCFCESKLLHITAGDVEHFHPKMEARFQDKSDKQLGYFWLAYNWDNLMLACERCNRVFKHIDFPLINIKRKAGVGKVEKTINTLLINPYKENPIEHINFRAEYIEAKTLKGTKTIQFLGLSRPELIERRGSSLGGYILLRKDYLATTIFSQNNIKLLQELLNGQFQALNDEEKIYTLSILYKKLELNINQPIISDDMEYAGMLRANFTQ
jgi:uncharacterized protein (TIGR02646 family)